MSAFYEGKTLNELYDHDVDNLSTLLNNRKKLFFDDMKDYVNFHYNFITNSLVSICGNEAKSIFSGKADEHDKSKLDSFLKKHNVRLERRKRFGDDSWRSGYYLYKDAEIVSFISLPRTNKEHSHIITPFKEDKSIFVEVSTSLKNVL